MKTFLKSTLIFTAYCVIFYLLISLILFDWNWYDRFWIQNNSESLNCLSNSVRIFFLLIVFADLVFVSTLHVKFFWNINNKIS